MPHRDTPIATENGIVTPFTYAAEMDWKKRHGILFSQDVIHPDHPFKEILIRHEDLRVAGIKKEDMEKIKTCRYDYYLKDKAPELKDGLTRIKELIRSFSDSENKESLQKKATELGDLQARLMKSFPRNAEYDRETDRGGMLSFPLTDLFLAFSRFINTYGEASHVAFNREAQGEIIKNLGLIKTSYEREWRETEEDYMSEKLVRDWLTKEKLLGDLIIKIKQQPFLMQCIFRKLVHCLREKQYIDYLREKAALEQIVETSTKFNDLAKVPDAIYDIQSLLDQVEISRARTGDTQLALSILQSTRNVLLDPTKENRQKHEELANSVIGKPFWRKAAWTMLAIGAVALTLAAIIASGVVTAGGACVLYGVIAGSASALVSGGLFAYGRRKALSKAMMNAVTDEVVSLSQEALSKRTVISFGS